MQIFIDGHIDLQQQLNKKGFVKINLLPDVTIKELLEVYHKYPNPKNNYFGFHVTLDLQEQDKISMISDKIAALIQPYTDTYFADYRFISPRYAVKEPTANSDIPPHQDWSFVDESRYQSYNLWIALTPSTLENGTLGFLKGSHNVLNNFRATPLPIFHVPFHDYAYELSGELEFITLEAGEALLFNSRIIHASRPNKSNSPRITIATEITSKEAELKHYYLSPTNQKIEQYAIDADFFTIYSNAKLTALFNQRKSITGYPVQAVLPNKLDKISKDELLSECSKY
ncbi:MAG: phytanoyl-CoA dioxygenase family protein [Chitinophagales bacterium]